MGDEKKLVLEVSEDGQVWWYTDNISVRLNIAEQLYQLTIGTQAIKMYRQSLQKDVSSIKTVPANTKINFRSLN